MPEFYRSKNECRGDSWMIKTARGYYRRYGYCVSFVRPLTEATPMSMEDANSVETWLGDWDIGLNPKIVKLAEYSQGEKHA